jgi:hypothetical protein
MVESRLAGKLNASAEMAWKVANEGAPSPAGSGASASSSGAARAITPGHLKAETPSQQRLADTTPYAGSTSRRNADPPRPPGRIIPAWRLGQNGVVTVEEDPAYVDNLHKLTTSEGYQSLTSEAKSAILNYVKNHHAANDVDDVRIALNGSGDARSMTLALAGDEWRQHKAQEQLISHLSGRDLELVNAISEQQSSRTAIGFQSWLKENKLDAFYRSVYLPLVDPRSPEAVSTQVVSMPGDLANAMQNRPTPPAMVPVDKDHPVMTTQEMAIWKRTHPQTQGDLILINDRLSGVTAPAYVAWMLDAPDPYVDALAGLMMVGGAVGLAAANAPARQETAKPSIQERPPSAPAPVNEPLPRPDVVLKPAAPPARNPVPPTGPKLGASVVPPPGRVVGPTWKKADLAPAPLKGDVSPELMEKKEGGKTGERRQSLNAGEPAPASSRKPRAPTSEKPIVEFAKRGVGGPQGPRQEARAPSWLYREMESLVRAAEAETPGTKAFDDALQKYRNFIDEHMVEAKGIDSILNGVARSIRQDNPEIKTAQDIAKWLEHRQEPIYVALRVWLKLFNRAEELMRHGSNMN